MLHKNWKLTVKGMACGGCESAIENALGQLEAVTNVHADHVAGSVIFDYDDSVTNTTKITNAIEVAGYEVVEEGAPQIILSTPSATPGQTNKWDARIRNILVFLALIVLIGGIVQWGRSQMPGVMMQLGAGLSYTTLFMIGLLTGFHCIGMCGSFVVNYSKHAKTMSEATKLHVAYGTGKTLSYALIGALFGLAGALVTVTPVMRGWAALAAGLFLLLFGLKMLGVIPTFRWLNLHFPKAMTTRVMGEIGRSRLPFVTGLLNGLLLGCGPLQAMYIMAAGTGSPTEGAFMLASFGLGTLPALIGFGFFASYLSHKSIRQLVHVSAVLVIFMGLLMFNRGYALLSVAPVTIGS